MEYMAVVKRTETNGKPSTRRELIDINESPESDSPFWKLSSQQCLPKDKPMHYLSQVKPQTMKQLLSHREFCEEIRATSSGDAEVMELFPQRTGVATMKPISSGTCLPPAPYHHHHHHVAEKSADHQPQRCFLLKSSGIGGAGCASPATPRKQPSAQLTIFYNGKVNVYDVSADQAQAIMNVLADDGNTHKVDPDTSFSEREVCTTTSGSSNSPLGSKASGQNEVPTALPVPKQTPKADSRQKIENLRNAGLPLTLARKQSLQRFLRRRQIRLDCVAPYTIIAAAPNKAVDDKVGAPLTLAEQHGPNNVSLIPRLLNEYAFFF